MNSIINLRNQTGKHIDLDNAIDSEVYKLYGLTEDEIKIVEEMK